MNGSYLSMLPSNYKAILFCLNLWYIPIDYGKIHHQQHKFYIGLIAWSIGFLSILEMCEPQYHRWLLFFAGPDICLFDSSKHPICCKG